MGGVKVLRGAFIAALLVAKIVCLPESVNFNSFDNSRDQGRFNFSNEATIDLNALQVTPDTRNNDPIYTLKNRSGRVILKNSYSIWRKSSWGNSLSSFNTSFVLNISPVDKPGAEGLAFIIASGSSVTKPDNSHGHWLGLFNSSTNGDGSSNQMVAVEFDTRKNDGTNDPDDNHVGINVNNINSREFVSLYDYQIDLKRGNDYNVTAWIQYDGHRRLLDVYVAKWPDLMPSKPILSYLIDLSHGVLDQNAYFGFSASTGETTELNCVLSWNLSIEPATSDLEGSASRAKLLISLCVGVATAFVAAICFVVLCMKYRKSRAEAAIMATAFENLPGLPREFRYKDLKKATNNFSAHAELGRGGYGAVYKGVLPKDETVVAVKRIFKDSKQGKEEFISEISIINNLRHRNLVPLLGWCHDKGHLMMVYEYMPNNSLDRHIYQGLLDWEQRYNVVSGVASALFYLHEECEQQVIHRDLKASNIMLDSDCNARLGDFGLARLLERDRESYTSTMVAGTIGYIAPEYSHTGRATVESDVFSFGAVALEVACGRAPRVKDAPDLVSWVWKLYRENNIMEAADVRLFMANNGGNVNEDDIKCLLMVGLACSTPNPGDRPTMRQVTQILARNMPPPLVPPFRPPFILPDASSDSNFAIISTSREYGLASVQDVFGSSSINTQAEEHSNQIST